jgi:hypothetical protein
MGISSSSYTHWNDPENYLRKRSRAYRKPITNYSYIINGSKNNSVVEQKTEENKYSAPHEKVVTSEVRESGVLINRINGINDNK